MVINYYLKFIVSPMLQSDNPYAPPLAPAVSKPWQQDAPQPQQHGSYAQGQIAQNQDPVTLVNNWSYAGVPRFLQSSFYAAPYGSSPYSYGQPQAYPQVIRNIQEGSQQITNTLSSTMATLSGFVQLIDSTVYSAWSSVTAILALVTHVSTFHDAYLSGVARLIYGSVKRLFLKAFGYTEGGTGRRSVDARKIGAAVLGCALALSLLAKKALELHNRQLGMEREPAPARPLTVRAAFPFAGNSPRHLAILPGDVVGICPEDMDLVGSIAWLRGWTTDGRFGYLPANYVQLVRD